MVLQFLFVVTGIILVTGLAYFSVSEFNAAIAFPIGGGGGGGSSMPSFGGSTPQSSEKPSSPSPSSTSLPSFDASPEISSGKPSTSSSTSLPSFGGGSTGKTSAIKQPSCVSQGSCTGTNGATNLKPPSSTTNTISKSSIEGGSANVVTNSNDDNKNTAVITNPDVDVNENENNVDVNDDDSGDDNTNNADDDEASNNYYYYSGQPVAEQTSNYYYQQETNTVDDQDSSSTNEIENPQVVYNNSIINPTMSVIALVGATTGANTISGIDDGKGGQTLELVGTSNEKYVEIKNAQSIELSEDDITLGEDDSLSLSFSSDSNKWIEKSYTNYNN